MLKRTIFKFQKLRKIPFTEGMQEGGVTVIGPSGIHHTHSVTSHPKPGEVVSSTESKQTFGGKGSNQAICIKKLTKDAPVHFVSSIGDDEHGKNIKKHYNGQDLGEHLKIIGGINTSISNIIKDETGKKKTILSKGASEHLTKQHIDESWDSIGKTKVLLASLGVHEDVVQYALEKGKKRGMTLILNAAPAHSWIPDSMFRNADFLILNKEEAEIITGVHIKNIETATKSLNLLHKKGASKVIILLGPKGLVYGDNGEVLHVHSERVHPVDTEGAGDCFIGSFAYLISCGAEPKKAIEIASQIAGISIQKEGIDVSYPTRKELTDEQE
jgi:ribokinase